MTGRELGVPLVGGFVSCALLLALTRLLYRRKKLAWASLGGRASTDIELAMGSESPPEHRPTSPRLSMPPLPRISLPLTSRKNERYNRLNASGGSGSGGRRNKRRSRTHAPATAADEGDRSLLHAVTLAWQACIAGGGARCLRSSLRSA